MSTKGFVWLGLIVGSALGGWLGSLVGHGFLSWQSILGNTLGAFIGIYGGYKLSQYF